MRVEKGFGWKMGNREFDSTPPLPPAAAAALFLSPLPRKGKPKQLLKRGCVPYQRHTFESRASSFALARHACLSQTLPKISNASFLFPCRGSGNRETQRERKSVVLWLPHAGSRLSGGRNHQCALVGCRHTSPRGSLPFSIDWKTAGRASAHEDPQKRGASSGLESGKTRETNTDSRLDWARLASSASAMLYWMGCGGVGTMRVRRGRHIIPFFPTLLAFWRR